MDWHPWGDEAFTKAQQQDKPVFLSIGYATCHWCHVMAHESFEDEEVAYLLNDTFICIKVDREERPDIDNLYMKACHLLTGSGGWPLTIIMTPDKKPFFAATYIPKTPRYGMIGIMQLTKQIQTLWRTQKEQLVRSAEQITTLLTTAAQQKNKRQKIEARVLDAAYESLLASFDEHHGGFSSAPKFPTPHHLFFLLRYWKRTNTPYALTMVERTLEQMRLGGIFDQIGYGFHRYATDAQWNIPHFEKMLYDQALLLIAYTEAYQATHQSLYKQIAMEIGTYVLRDMTSPSGGFYSAEDADSDGEEGKYYTWTSEELENLLSPDDFHLLTTVFPITRNPPARAETTKQAPHRQILFFQQNFKESAQLLGLNHDQLITKIKEITTVLYLARKKRTPPLKDDKILCDWNGLMIAALAKAGMVFGEESYVKTAENAVKFLEKNLIKKTGQLLHRFRDGSAGIQGFADDYAFLIWGLLELYQACFDVKYLRIALKLNRFFIERFWDDQQKGFFFSESVDSVLPRTKEWYDGALPTANSVSSMNLLRLSRMTGDIRFEEMAEDLLRCISDRLLVSPAGYTALLTSVDLALGPSQEIIVVGANKEKDTRAFLSEIRRMFLPSSVVLFLPLDRNRSLYEEVFPFSASYSPVGGKATVYFCENHQCKQPVTSVQDLRKLLC